MINLNEIAIVVTEVGIFEGTELLRVGEILASDIVVTKEDIQSLVDTEMNEGCHDDNIEDYESELDFYLSSTKSDTYTQYIMERLDEMPIDNEVANVIVELVEEGIREAYEKIEKKRKLNFDVNDILTDINIEYNLHSRNISIVYQGASDGSYIFEGDSLNILDDEEYGIITLRLSLLSELVNEAIKSGVIENEEDIWN